MSREEFLENRICSLYETKKAFALKIDMPYSTLLSILKNVGGSSLDNIFKICHGLNLRADDLSIFDTNEEPMITAKEQDLLAKYRQLSPSGKATVDAVIEVQYDAVQPKVTEEEETS